MKMLIAIIFSLPLMAQEVCISVPETLHYSIEYNGQRIGKALNIIEKATFEGKTVFKYLGVTDVVKQGRNIRDSVILYFDKDWTPIYQERYIKGMNLSLTTHYKDGKASVKLNLAGKEKSFTISYPQGAVDNEEILPFLRCIDVKKVGSGEIVDITPIGGQTVKIKWKYEGTAKMNDMEVARVLLKMPMKKVELFIKGGKVVKYFDKSSGLEMILQE